MKLEQFLNITTSLRTTYFIIKNGHCVDVVESNIDNTNEFVESLLKIGEYATNKSATVISIYNDYINGMLNVKVEVKGE